LGAGTSGYLGVTLMVLWAVQVGTGPHVVRFVFEPWSFRPGVLLAGAGLAMVLAPLG
jgi:hypothetical protein